MKNMLSNAEKVNKEASLKLDTGYYTLYDLRVYQRSSKLIKVLKELNK